VTVRPLESLDFGPVGLQLCQHKTGNETRTGSYPTMTGSFSFSDSSKAVCGATRGSGVHSSTKSSISYSHHQMSTRQVRDMFSPVPSASQSSHCASSMMAREGIE
jgi:hypothetical protein